MTNHHKPGGPKARENYSVTNLEARSLKVLATLVLSGGYGGDSVLFLIHASGGNQQPFMFLGLQLGHSNFCLHVHMAFSLSLSLHVAFLEGH